MRLRPCVHVLQGDNDSDAKRSRPSIGKTRFVPREERARACGWDPFSGSHQGQQPKRLHSKAEYIAAPEHFAEPSDFNREFWLTALQQLMRRSPTAELPKYGYVLEADDLIVGVILVISSTRRG